MSNDEKLELFKETVLELERECLSKVDPLTDKQMALKIMKLYEENSKDDNQ